MKSLTLIEGTSIITVFYGRTWEEAWRKANAWAYRRGVTLTYLTEPLQLAA